ncbi:MAG: trehalose-6-phosphate synthase [Bacteroidetes bacterium]|nr:trehalose-6-phosphate synthase [Bacteroidota bacterium]
MRINLALVVAIVISVGIVALGFTFYQVSAERIKLTDDLEKRMADISLKLSETKFVQSQKGNLNYSIDSICKKYNLEGITIYFGDDSIVSNLKVAFDNSKDYVLQSIAADSINGNFISVDGKKLYQYIQPLTREGIANNAIIFYSDPEYIENLLDKIWFRNFFRWFLQALFVSLITIVILKWGIFSPINRVSDWIKSARMGNLEKLNEYPPAKFLAPLHAEITQIARAMHEAQAKAEEEARLRTTGESVWTSDRLKIEMGNLLNGKKMIVVSNREPYMHIHEGKEIKCIVPASGMITAMEPILKACGGLWIASGSGDADKETVDKDDKVQVPPLNPKYTLKRVWLTKEEESHYYYGFSNEGLWPLCHLAHTRPTFRIEDWEYYKKVNEKFAETILEECKDEEQPFILIQDYHFALLPELIKRKKPRARVAIFWHIPWPNPESFGICPWQKEILTGMLGADLIGFHTQYHCNHFLETVNNTLESRVSWEKFSVKMNGRNTHVKAFPISIAFTLKDLDDKSRKEGIKRILGVHGINAEFMAIGVDRIDYTKGLIEKFLSVERFFEKFPDYIGRFTLVQIGAPSRTLIKSYSDMVSDVEKEAERINLRFKSKNWKPILFLKGHHSHEQINPYYKNADMCIVSSLHDGMNLVAKEFVATRNENDGVLILSRFAGASLDLTGALIINPYDIENSAIAIRNALEMSISEQESRMMQMRETIVGNNIYYWASSLLRAMASIQN